MAAAVPTQRRSVLACGPHASRNSVKRVIEHAIGKLPKASTIVCMLRCKCLVRAACTRTFCCGSDCMWMAVSSTTQIPLSHVPWMGGMLNHEDLEEMLHRELQPDMVGHLEIVLEIQAYDAVTNIHTCTAIVKPELNVHDGSLMYPIIGTS